MVEPIALLVYLREYHGNCDRCGEEINEPIVLASDMQTKDKYGNKLYLVLGIPEADGVHGHHMNCEKCGGRQIILRLYESTDVTDLVTNQEARHAL